MQPTEEYKAARCCNLHRLLYFTSLTMFIVSPRFAIQDSTRPLPSAKNTDIFIGTLFKSELLCMLWLASEEFFSDA
jgi:hypothetical protein